MKAVLLEGQQSAEVVTIFTMQSAFTQQVAQPLVQHRSREMLGTGIRVLSRTARSRLPMPDRFRSVVAFADGGPVQSRIRPVSFVSGKTCCVRLLVAAPFPVRLVLAD